MKLKSFLAVAGVLVTLLVTACGGGSGGGNNPPPPGGSMNPSRTLAYSIDGTVAGLTGAGLVLQNNGGDNLSVSTNGGFTFATALANGSAYSATISTQPAGQTCTVMNGVGVVGITNVTNVSVICTSSTRAWRTPTLIETDNVGHAYEPQIAYSIGGNAVAVWRQDDGTRDAGGVIRNNIWANHYSVGSGWGSATLIETGAYNAFTPQVTIDAVGNAIAVWYQSDGTRNNIWANRYTVGSGWGAETLIETNNVSNAYPPQIAMDTLGNAIAVWRQLDGRYDSIWANRYTLGTGWGIATPIETEDTNGTHDPQITFDAMNNAIVIWVHDDRVNDRIGANFYTAGVGWGAATFVNTSNTSNAENLQIAIGATGNATAVWEQGDQTYQSIWANRYTVGVGWDTAILLETDNAGSAYAPQIASDPFGNAIAVWHQSNGTHYNIYANRYTAGVGWGTAALIETVDESDAYPPQIGFDADGNATVVWRQSNGNSSILSNRYMIGVGWGTTVLIESIAGHMYEPQLAVDPAGNALAVWSHYDGALFRYNIMASRYE